MIADKQHVERTYHCEGPGCEAHAKTADPPPYLPRGFVATREVAGVGVEDHHFCGWDCLMRYAAQFPPPEHA
jgi:hypothetical protein